MTRIIWRKKKVQKKFKSSIRFSAQPLQMKWLSAAEFYFNQILIQQNHISVHHEDSYHFINFPDPSDQGEISIYRPIKCNYKSKFGRNGFVIRLYLEERIREKSCLIWKCVEKFDKIQKFALISSNILIFFHFFPFFSILLQFSSIPFNFSSIFFIFFLISPIFSSNFLQFPPILNRIPPNFLIKVRQKTGLNVMALFMSWQVFRILFDA